MEPPNTRYSNNLTQLLDILPLIPFRQQLQESNDAEVHSRRIDLQRLGERWDVCLPEEVSELRERCLGRQIPECWTRDAGIGNEHVNETVCFGNDVDGPRQVFFGSYVALNRDDVTVFLSENKRSFSL
jgi:hypothetical protein